MPCQLLFPWNDSHPPQLKAGDPFLSWDWELLEQTHNRNGLGMLLSALPEQGSATGERRGREMPTGWGEATGYNVESDEGSYTQKDRGRLRQGRERKPHSPCTSLLEEGPLGCTSWEDA